MSRFERALDRELLKAVLAGFRLRAIATPLITAVFACFGGLVPAHSQSFQVGNLSVCANAIKSRNDVCKEVTSLSGLKRSEFETNGVHFRFTILGRRDAIEYLRSQNYLPVRVGIWRNGFRFDDDISLDIRQTDWAASGEELTAQVKADGLFRWRTFFHVNLRDSRRISIDISNARGTTVPADEGPARLSLAFSE